MKKIEIRIDKAVLNSFQVHNLPEGEPEVMAFLDLYAGENKITQISLSTNDYNKKKKFKLPFKLYESIGKIAGELERLVTLKLKSAMSELPAHDASKEI